MGEKLSCGAKTGRLSSSPNWADEAFRLYDFLSEFRCYGGQVMDE